MGSAYKAQGDLTKGLAFQEQALEMLQALHGDTPHPDVATSLNNVGCAYEAQGDLTKGLAFQEQALQMRQALYGNTPHPDVATSLNNVGCAYEAQGDLTKGLAFQEQALEMFQALYGNTPHPEVAASLNNVGSAYFQQGHYQTAMDYLKQARDMMKRVADPNHPSTQLYERNYTQARASHQRTQGLSLPPAVLASLLRAPSSTTTPDTELTDALALSTAEEHLRQHQWQGALDALAPIDSNSSAAAEAHHLRAQSYQGLGNHSAAIARYQDALALRPDDETLQESLAILLSLSSDPAEATEPDIFSAQENALQEDALPSAIADEADAALLAQAIALSLQPTASPEPNTLNRGTLPKRTSPQTQETPPMPTEKPQPVPPSFTLTPDQRPTPYQYALMSQHVYMGEAIQVGDTLDTPDEAWRVQRIHTGPNNYFGVLYVHDALKQVVLVHRGTDSVGALKEDLQGVVLGRLSPQQQAVYVATEQAIEFARDTNAQLSFSGHSLGAWLAELSVYFCHAAFNTPAVSALTFESPGSKRAMDGLQPHLDWAKIDTNQLDITEYLSYPNRINTYNPHVGTIYQLATQLSLNFLTKRTYRYTTQAHSIEGILDYLEDAPPCPALSRWPLGSNLNSYFQQTDLAKEKWSVPNAKREGFKAAFASQYQTDALLSQPQCIALRHFAPGLRAFLNDLYQAHRAALLTQEGREMLASQWQDHAIPEPLIKLLLNYTLRPHHQQTVLTVTDGTLTATAFRQHVSRLLAEREQAIPQLLQPLSSQQKQVIAAIIAPGARVEGSNLERYSQMLCIGHV